MTQLAAAVGVAAFVVGGVVESGDGSGEEVGGGQDGQRSRAFWGQKRYAGWKWSHPQKTTQTWVGVGVGKVAVVGVVAVGVVVVDSALLQSSKDIGRTPKWNKG